MIPARHDGLGTGFLREATMVPTQLPAGEPGRGGAKMRNPFMTKNPFMSAWLSSANRIAGAARGQATAAAKRQTAQIQADATRQVLDFWTGKTAPAPRKKKTR